MAFSRPFWREKVPKGRMRGRVQLHCHKRMLDQTHWLIIVIIMTSLPHLTIKPPSVEDGGGYLFEFLDFPGCVADGATPEEAIREGREALMSYTRTLEELGRKIPAQGAAFAGQWR